MQEALHAEEMFEVVDDRGNPTGEVLGKAEVHARELRHPDVHVALITDNEALIQRRAMHKTWPGLLDILGGHRPVGESSQEAAVREVLEEYGLVIEPRELQHIGTIGEDLLIGDKMHRTHGQYYVVHRPEMRLADITPRQEEIAGVTLYPIEQLAADLANPKTAAEFVPHIPEAWQLCLSGIESVLAARR